MREGGRERGREGGRERGSGGGREGKRERGHLLLQIRSQFRPS